MPTTNPQHSSSMPVDLEILVRIERVKGRDTLQYVLHSPSGKADFYFKRIRGEEILGSLEGFRASLMERLEKLRSGHGAEGELLFLADVAGDLDDLGRWLYRQCFGAELRLAYRQFRDKVETLLITSDEPWIPWELVKPFDDSDVSEIIDDDFLCLKFQLTRWLSGYESPARAIPVRRLAGIDGSHVPSLPALGKAGEELALLTKIGQDHPDIVDVSLSPATFRSLKHLLEEEDVDLLHIVGHGNYSAERPDDSKIEFSDRPFRADKLSGPLASRIRRNRPLVFLNACRVARQGWALTGLGGWASAWVLGAGCGAFIAPQWAVSDDLACEFARHFYTALSAGETFGAAAQKARKTMSQKHPGRPTWLAYSVYAHPNGRLVLGSAAKVDRLPAPDYARAWGRAPDKIRESILHQDLFIEEKTRGFVGRQWVFDAIDHFIEQESRGYFLFYGEPGIGKSALMAELVKRRGYLHHFNIRADGLNRAEIFLANLCAQLIAAYDLPHTFLPPEASRDARFLSSLLENIAAKLNSRGEKLVLLVDGLDEADSDSWPRGVNTLYLPSLLPQGVYIVASSRPAERKSLRIHCQFQFFELAQDGEGNLADIREFIENRLKELPGIHDYIRRQELEAEDFVVEMVGKSQGNFMYLHHMLPAIAEGVYQDRDFSTLPEGLENYYEDHWQLIRHRNETAWFAYKLPVLIALTIVREPVSVELIKGFSDVEERARILEVLGEWCQFLFVVESEEVAGEVHKRYRIYHASFQDFVAEKEEVAGERVDIKAAHGLIAGDLWTTLYGPE